MKKLKILTAILAVIIIAATLFVGCGEVVGKSAYELAVENGFEGTLAEWFDSLRIEGKSAYELAVENGFEGTLEAWLESLKGTDGTSASVGKSAYELAVENGFEGTLGEWLDSLKGEDGVPASVGKSAYELAVESGFEGTLGEWLDSLKGEDGVSTSVGKSAYELAVESGFEGTLGEWLDSLKGEDGAYASTGKSAYELAVESGFEGTLGEWLGSLRGEPSDITSSAYAANKAILSSVTVYSEFSKGGTATTSAGSGVIIEDDKENGDAYIITNYHVVYEKTATPQISDNIVVRLYALNYSNYSIPATYLGGSLTYDLAVLKVENSDIYKNSSARPAAIADTFISYVGETAIAIGNPQGTGLSVTTGIISVESEKIEMKGADGVTDVEFRVVRVDTAVNNGNSGGGLFNVEGELIGIVNAKIISANVENIGYAIPLSVVKYAYGNIRRNCDGGDNTVIKRCLLGVTITADEIFTLYNGATGMTDIIEKVIVHSVGEGAAAGLLEVGDEIVSFTYDNITYPVTRVFQIVDFSLSFVHNETVTLNIVREGVPIIVPIPLVNITDFQ